MTEPVSPTHELIDTWADDPRGPVALHLRQKLRSVEDTGEGPPPVIFPPTYADVGYNIDPLSDGTKVATIDSVGAQANRMEPLFKTPPLSALVPQIDVVLGNGKSVSVLDAGHRLGDALVRSTALRSEAQAAFASLQRGNAEPIARLAPTSLVFGAWDSRGEGAKLPRIIQSVIRAWDVDVLKRSAQYNPPLDYSALDVFDAEDKAKAEGNTKSPLAQRGFVHVPASDQPGGIVARGGVWRDVTINLIALRRLEGDRIDALRRYILGLCLVAAAEPLDGFLRVGCLLTPDPASHGAWVVVDRQGVRSPVALTSREALDYAAARAKTFGVAEARTVSFDKEAAKADLADGTADGKKASKKTKAVAG
ncbi:hypothetical protein RHODGE_RHODGE_00134 [Rhodoplanes serenus]|uniref:Type I-U CRISPR-associated protein Cas7 n=1 Tax=Rhodoplanes serenus TaxID=200615 RepID=A0A447CPI4_9BRAD|nr:type I-U CRISPR-associated RAMP protein Csb1/Cas7u [Rhodoplanes serenus]VCU07044.1 hypothetical protein RHODGE_RHODGE_00134 [Rhodoplanes serenus]